MTDNHSPAGTAAAESPIGAFELYKHRKGGFYRILGQGKVQTDTPLGDYAEIVVYQSEEDGLIWARPSVEFFDGRFSPQPRVPKEPDQLGLRLAVNVTADAKDERIAELEAQLAAMEARKDGAYEERNRVVAALAKLFPSGTRRTDIPGWSHDWHGCVRIDLPTGQVSWHFHDTHAHLFAELPAYAGEWDGHDTPEKYRRLAALSAPTEPASMGGGDRVWLDRRVAHRHAVELEQCSIFAADVGDAIAKAMTDAAADLRTAPAIFSAACNDPRNEADRLELIEQATRLLAKAKRQESSLRTPATVQFLTDVIATLTRWEAP